MGNLYIVHTSAGSIFANAEQPVTIDPVKSEDGCIEVTVKDLDRYRWAATSFFDKAFVDKDPKQIEQHFLEADEEPYNFYKIAREMLFNEEGKTFFHEELNKHVDEHAFGSKKSLAEFAHDYLVQGAKELGFETVMQSTVGEWLSKSTRIGPRDWRNFYGLSLMEKESSLAEGHHPDGFFKVSYEDFKKYESWLKNPEAGSMPSYKENLYSAFLAYYTGRFLFGIRGNIEGDAARSKRRKKVSVPGKRSKFFGFDTFRDKIKAKINHDFAEFVTDDIRRVMIYGAEKVEPHQRAEAEKMKKHKSSATLKRALVQPPDSSDVKKKSLREICEEVCILERALLNYSAEPIKELCNGTIILEGIGRITPKEHIYIEYAVHEKIIDSRVVDIARYKRDNTGISQSRRKVLDDIAEKMCQGFFAHDTQFEKVKAFQNLHKAYLQLYPAYPKEYDNLNRVNQRKYTRLKEIARANMKERKKKKARAKAEEDFQIGINKIGQRLIAKGLVKDLFMFLPSEKIKRSPNFGLEQFKKLAPDRVIGTLNQTQDAAGKHEILNNFYSSRKIEDVLRKYGGESLIEENIDLILMRKVEEFIPGMVYNTSSTQIVLPIKGPSFL